MSARYRAIAGAGIAEAFPVVSRGTIVSSPLSSLTSHALAVRSA